LETFPGKLKFYSDKIKKGCQQWRSFFVSANFNNNPNLLCTIAGINNSVKHYLKIIGIVIGIKILYFVFAISISSYVKNIGLSFNFQSYVSTVKSNDSYWYEAITYGGYSKITDKKDLGYHTNTINKQSEWAFFPAYPLIIRETKDLFNSDFNKSGIFWAIIFSILAFIGFYIWMNKSDNALFCTLVFMCFPFHYYFSMLYTEALFFSCIIFSFIAVRSKKLWLLSILLIPLTLLRPNGIVLILPLYLYFLEQEKVFEGYRLIWKRIDKRIILKSFAFITAPIAFILYGLYQQHMTGEFFAFILAQAGWNRSFTFPLFSLFNGGDFTTQFFSIYTILFFVIGIISWKRLPLSINIMIWMMLLLPLFSGSMLSMPRFISIIFPFSIIIGTWMYKIKLKYVFLSILFALQLVSYYFWLTGSSMGY